MPSNTRRVRSKKEKKTTRRSWLDTVLQDTSSAETTARPSSSTSSNDPRSTLSNTSPISAVSESEADVVAFLTDAAIHRRQHFEEERKQRKLPAPIKRNEDDLQHRMRPCEVGPLPNFGPQNPLLKGEEELLSLHKRSLDDLKPSSPAQWMLPFPPPTAKHHSLEDSEATPGDGRWLPISPPLTADKPTFTTTTTTTARTSQQPPADVASTPPPPPTIAPSALATSNLRAIAPKAKKQGPLTIPTAGYEEMFKDTPRLIEEQRGQGHVEARRRGGDE